MFSAGDRLNGIFVTERKRDKCLNGRGLASPAILHISTFYSCLHAGFFGMLTEPDLQFCTRDEFASTAMIKWAPEIVNDAGHAGAAVG